MKVIATVWLKDGVLDPQGQTVAGALRDLGFGGVGGVRQGRVFEIDVEAASEDEARAKAEAMCQQLLANPVIERFEVGEARAG